VSDVESLSVEFDRLVPRDAHVELVSTGHLFTEGPVWNARRGFLLWVDIAGDAIWRWMPGQDPEVYLQPSGKANGLTYDAAGRLVAAGWTSRCVWRQELDGSITMLATHFADLKLGTPNDIVVRSDGAIYWTDGTSGARHPGFEAREDLQIYRNSSVVLRWAPGTGDVTMATDEAGSCNGLAFSPDESILYVNDSSARCIDAFDVAADGTLVNGRVFARDTGSATKVDVHGNVFCTGKGGVLAFDPDGHLLGRIRVPEKGSKPGVGRQ
jgi:gluconolactonase